MSDEARKDVVFHEKYPFVRTPNIDSLRGEAVSFHNCFANYPVCVPSRSSVITGRYPHQIGVLRNTHRLPAGERDLGHHLTAHGFDCVSFGKTHNTNHGFRSVTYDKVATMGFENHGYLEDPDLITGVFEGAADEYCDFVACRQFDGYLRGRAGGGPFAAFVGIYAPHPPLYPPREYAGLYSADEIALSPQPTARDNAAIDPGGPAPELERLSRRDPARSDRQLPGADHAVRRLRGPHPGHAAGHRDARRHFGGAGFRSRRSARRARHGGKMGNLYEASIRVPLVIRLPGGAHAGAERSQMAEMVDLLPTICDVLGVPHPEGMQAPVGRSLAPVVADPEAEHRHVVHAMLLEGQMARSQDLKLNFYADDTCELYDLADDPGETVNRYDDPAYRDRRQELLEEIARFLIRHPRVPDRGGNGFFG